MDANVCIIQRSLFSIEGGPYYHGDSYRYINELLEKSTPRAPVWNIEKIKEGKESTWNYIDGCMIKAVIELYQITKDKRYLAFADDFIDYFVREDGSIASYDPKEYNLDNVNAGKTLFDLYKLTGKEKYRKAIDTVYSQLAEQPPNLNRKFLAQKDLPQSDLAGRPVYGPALLYAV